MIANVAFAVQGNVSKGRHRRNQLHRNQTKTNYAKNLMPFNLNSSIGTILIDCLHVTRVMEGGGGRAVIRAGNRDTDAITKTQFRDAMQSLIDCRSLNCHKSCRLDLEVWFARTRFNIKEKRVLTTRQNHLMDLITRREAHICL